PRANRGALFQRRVDRLGRPLLTTLKQQAGKIAGLLQPDATMAGQPIIGVEDALARRVVQIDRERVVEVEFVLPQRGVRRRLLKPAVCARADYLEPVAREISWPLGE